MAGMSEMLVQSHLDDIHLLAALPEPWRHGQVRGLHARGGFDIVSMDWQNGKVSKVVIRSWLGGNCRIQVPNALKGADGVVLKPASGATVNPIFGGEFPNESGQSKTQVYDFQTQRNRTYTLVMAQ